MKAGWVLFKLEWKKYGKAVPALAIESLLFGLLLLAFGFFASKAVYGQRSVGEIRAGIVSEEESRLSRMLVKFAGSMDSLKDTCSFTMMPRKEAEEKLSDGSIYAAVFLPEGMVEGIMNGQNIPAEVVFSNANSRMEAEVFKELADAGAGLLQTAQAGIYAADELCLSLGHRERIKETEDYLNQAYLEYAMNRNAVFKLQEVNAAGKVSLVQYYTAAVLLMFLSFSGVIIGRKARSGTDGLCGILKAKGLSVWHQYLADHFAFSGIFAAAGWLISFPCLGFLMNKTGQSFPGLKEGAFLFLLLLSMGMVLRLAVELTGSGTGGTGICFVFVLLGMLFGGLFLPAAFLPEWMAEAGRYLLYPGWMEGLFAIMKGESLSHGAVVFSLWAAAGTAGGALVRTLKAAGGRA